MVKKSILYIFIYTLLVGCHTILDSQNMLTNNNEECEYQYFLEIEATSLYRDSADYYHIEWLEGYEQTFTTLSAKTGSDEFSQKILWTSDSGIQYMNSWVSSVNPASYTDENGMTHTVLAAWEEQINDTIIVYAAYEDGCGFIYYDSLGVVIDNEE